jgi:hypothetical protein
VPDFGPIWRRLEEVCALFEITSGARNKLRAVDYGKQLIENTLNETVEARRPRPDLPEQAADVSNVHRRTAYQGEAWLRIMRPARNSVRRSGPEREAR